MMHLDRPAVLDRLTAVQTVEAEKRFTVQEASTLIDALRNVTPLSETAKLCGLTPAEVLDLTGKLGTWLTHSVGSAGADTETSRSRAQLSLFQDARENVVVVPPGFERRGKQRRDVNKALAAIVVHAPSESDLVRWHDRAYPDDQIAMTARDVYVWWSFARLGRIEELSDVSTSVGFSRIMVEAFDLLNVAITDAAASLAIAVDESASAEDVADCCAAMLWVHEARVLKLQRLARICAGSGDVTALRREQRSFRTDVARSPMFQVTDLADLSQGQVVKIVQAAGLAETTSRKDESELRKRLIDLGLERDLDLLVPLGLRAGQRDLDSVFWSAIDLRAKSDPNWRLELDEAIFEAGL